MSVESITIALHHSRARGTAKLVLIGIANHDGDGGAWPSLATLAKYAGVTPRNVQKALRELEALGEILTHRQQGGMGEMRDFERPNLYDFTLACPVECDGTKKHRTVPPVATDTGGVSHPTGGGVSVATPKPSLEPPSKPSLGPTGPGASQPAATRSARRVIDPADLHALAKLCARIGDETDLHSIWWTLRLEHGARRPSRLMTELVDKGEWDGFVGRHGIGEYTADGTPA